MESVKVVGGWAALIAAAGAFYWVSNQKKNKNRRTVVPKPSAKITEPRKEPKTKKAKKDTVNDQDTKQKSRATPTPKSEEKAYTSAVDDTAGDEVDNREFARQLSNAKSGTIISGKAQTTSNRQKSVKQTRAQEKPIVESSDNATAPSSATGGDADDDQSPMDSPELNATSMDPVASGDVSDMLEKTNSGPQVLKITSPTNAASAKKPKTAKPAEPQETKKQRQNRQKAEANRLQREAEEKERKVLEEKQRRTAREAEGRAAKDGSVFMASKAPSSSAWAPAAPNGSPATPGSNVELLDTLEPTKTSSNGVKSKESSKLAAEYSGMSEEEQIRKIQEESADWKTVSKDKRKKKAPVANEDVEVKEAKLAAASKDFEAPALIAPTPPGQTWAVKTVYTEPKTGKAVEREEEIEDSEWEVA